MRVHSDRGGYPVIQHGPRDVNDVGIFCITLNIVYVLSFFLSVVSVFEKGCIYLGGGNHFS